MACTHVGLHQQQVVVGLQLAQLGDPFGGFPIGHARIVQPRCHHQRRVIARSHLIIGRIGQDIGERRLVGDRVAPFLPFARRQRQILVQHRVQHIDKRHVRDNCAVLRRVLIDDRAHQLTARRTAARRDHAFRRKALRDQPAACVDEIVEGVGAFEQLALQIPAPPQIIAAANMRDGIGKAAIHKGKPRGRKARRNGVAIGTVSIKVQRPRPFDPGLLEDVRAIFPHHDANRHHRPIARLHGEALRGVEAGIVTAGDFLRLQCRQPARRDIIIINRAGRDHALIGQPQLAHRIFGIVRKAGGIACLGKGDRGDVGRIGVGTQLDLIEPAQSPFGDEEILEQVKLGQIKLVRPRDHRLPVTGRFQLCLGEPEVDVIVIGQHPQLAIPDIDRIFDTLVAGLHQNRFSRGIGSGDEAHFAGFIVAGGDDQPVFLRR